MTQPNYRFWNPRIDEDLYNITIDTSLPIRIDHAPISGVTANPAAGANITSANQTSNQITTIRNIVTRFGNVTT